MVKQGKNDDISIGAPGRACTRSVSLAQAMQKVGVTGRPEVRFLEAAE